MRSTRLGEPQVGEMRGSGLRHYLRTGVALVLFCATTLTLIATSPGGASADTAAFYPGTSTATASALALVPSTGGLGYTITLSTANAEYEQALAKATSQTLNLGVIGTNPHHRQLQQAAGGGRLQPSSAGGPREQRQTPEPDPHRGRHLQRHRCRCRMSRPGDPGPSATATTRGGDFNVAGAIDLSGLDTNAVAQVVGGNTRDVARRRRRRPDLVAGRAGRPQGSPLGGQPAVGGASQLGGVVLHGVGRGGRGVDAHPSSSQLAMVIGIVNTALAPTGFHINLPVVTLLANAHDGNGAASKVSR